MSCLETVKAMGARSTSLDFALGAAQVPHVIADRWASISGTTSVSVGTDEEKVGCRSICGVTAILDKKARAFALALLYWMHDLPDISFVFP